MYTTAHDSLESLDPKVFGHWKLYFGLKSKFYLSYVSISQQVKLLFRVDFQNKQIETRIKEQISLCLNIQAYNYKGDALLSQDECGSGIRSLQESQKCKFFYKFDHFENSIALSQVPSSNLLS